MCLPACTTPGSISFKMDSAPYTNPVSYRIIVGALQYLANTRPDIAFSVSKLSQFLAAPTELQWQAVKDILRYLKGTTNLALHMLCSDYLDLVARCRLGGQLAQTP